MPTVDRRTPADPQWANGDTAPTPTAAPPATENKLETLSPGLANGDSWAEAKLRESFKGLQSAEAFELSGKMTLKAGEGAGGAAKLRVEREDDGSLKVSVNGEGSFLAGDGSVKVAAGTTWHFAAGHEAEAADLADALAKGALVTAAPMGTQALVSYVVNGTSPGELAGRIGAYSNQLSSMKLGAGLAVHLGHESKLKSGFDAWDFGKVKAGVEVGNEVAVNLEKGTFTVSRTVGVEAEGSVQVPLAFKAAVKGEAAATLSAEYRMPESMRRDIAEGRRSAADAWAELASRAVPDKLIARFELGSVEKGLGVVAGVSTKTTAEAEVELDVAAFLEDPHPHKVLEDLAHAKWTVKTETGGGTGFAVAAGDKDVKGSLEFHAQRMHRWSHEGLLLAEALHHLEHRQDDEQLVAARRAGAR